MARFTDKDYMEMPPEVLRSILRENTHHRLEEPLYKTLYDGKPLRPSAADDIRHLLEIWHKRGLAEEGDDLEWARRLLQLADQVKQGESPTPGSAPPHTLSAGERAVVEQVIFERRSIRHWTDRAVPREMVEKIIQAGLWAPHACNLQTLRVLWMQDEQDLALFQKSEVTGGKVVLVICQDLRPYECTAGVPERNRLLDCGAAVQNMLLMAHALGLGAVWLTFSGPQEKQLRTRFNLPDHIAVQTYLALGLADEQPLPPGRLRVRDVLLNPAE